MDAIDAILDVNSDTNDEGIEVDFHSTVKVNGKRKLCKYTFNFGQKRLYLNTFELC